MKTTIPIIYSIFISFVVSKNITDILLQNNIKDIPLLLLAEGEMADCCLTYSQYEKLLTQIQEEFPHLVEINSIGNTYLNRPILSLKFKARYHSSKAVLFTGMHHAREPVSMMMNMYIILTIIKLKMTDSPYIKDILNSVHLHFIPVINVDGYITNNENYKANQNYPKSWMNRKNARTPPPESNITCRLYDYGVDINRNYPFGFAQDNTGSSPKFCDEDYRGDHPFSEPETIAIRDFILSSLEIKIAFNYHSYGNLVIIPFNYLHSRDSKQLFQTKYTEQLKIYQEFIKEGHFPDRFVAGNGEQTVNYLANGDASDWMLGERKIVTISPELGINDSKADVFYPDRQTMFKILEKNLAAAMFGIQKASHFLKFFSISNTTIADNSINLQIGLLNNGLTDYNSNINFKVILAKSVKNLKITVQTGMNATNEIEQYPIKEFEFSQEENEFNIAYIKSMSYVLFNITFTLNKDGQFTSDDKDILVFIGKSKGEELQEDLFSSPEFVIKADDFNVNFRSVQKFKQSMIIISAISMSILLIILIIERITTRSNATVNDFSKVPVTTDENRGKSYIQLSFNNQGDF